MDLRLLHSNFIMDNREPMFHTTPDATHIFQDDRGFTYCAITAFHNGDPDISRDPLSTNRRLTDSLEFQMFGTMVVAGSTPDVIYVLIPDSVSSTVDGVSPAGLQHVVGLSLGSAENLSSTLPQDELHLALCDNSLRPSLTVGRQDCRTEITPILRKWQCERCCMPVLQSPHPGQYVPSPASFAYSESVLLALPGSHVPNVVFVRAERQRSFGADPQAS